MDGSIGDQFSRGRRIRPATLEFALSYYPFIIISLLQNRLQIDTSNSIGNSGTVQVWVPPLRMTPYVILMVDFLLIKKIALNSSLRIFSSDTTKDVEDRIRAQISVEFSGRN